MSGSPRIAAPDPAGPRLDNRDLADLRRSTLDISDISADLRAAVTARFDHAYRSAATPPSGPHE